MTVSGVTHDSRRVRPGDLYAALPGRQHHGAAFCDDAADAGAVAVLTDPDGKSLAAHCGLPVFVVADPRARLGEVAAWIYGYPSSRLMLIGVTGTSGKSTTTFLLESGLRVAGHLTGLVGGVETRVAGQVRPSLLTTPEATDLQALLAEMVQRGVTAAAMEVSSHALALGRVAGTSYEVAVFTNLSQDHLDFHDGMEDYFAAKASLFTPGYAAARGGQHRRPVGPQAGRRAADPAHHVLRGGPGRGRLAGHRRAQRRRRQQLPGHRPRRRVRRRVGGAARAVQRGQRARRHRRAGRGRDRPGRRGGRGGRLPGGARPPGAGGGGQDFTVLVDYSHKPGAVEAVLRALRPVTVGQLSIVLGCGGDRDRAKRPLMGAAAVALADLAILTSDNPRSEDPLAILAEMLQGVLDCPGRAARPSDHRAGPGRGHRPGHRGGGQGRHRGGRGQGARARPVRGRGGHPVRRPGGGRRRAGRAGQR